MKLERASLCQAAIWGIGALAVACTVYGVPTYPAAAVFGASAVGATALHRSATGECWAVCSNGWHCDQDSGLCVENAEQLPRASAKDASIAPSTPDGGQAAVAAEPTNDALDASDVSIAASGGVVPDAGSAALDAS